MYPITESCDTSYREYVPNKHNKNGLYMYYVRIAMDNYTVSVRHLLYIPYHSSFYRKKKTK